MTDPITAPAPEAPPIVPDAPVYNPSLVRRVDETDSLAYFWVRFDGEPTPFVAISAAPTTLPRICGFG